MSEQVLVFPAKLLDEIGYFQGFNKDGVGYLHKILSSEQTFFMDRDEAEENENFKQIIPYNILKYNDLLFIYQRAKKGAELRLRRKWSFGIGGHINKQDGSGFIGYHEGRYRELEEEVKINSSFLENVVGVIYDDSTDVGRVHFGIAHALELDSPEVESVDPALSQAAFLPIEQIKERKDVFETWSQIIIDNLL